MNEAVGTIVGRALGDGDGGADGVALGEADGVALGVELGDGDGAALGEGDGPVLGRADGTALGQLLDGLAVGAGVYDTWKSMESVTVASWNACWPRFEAFCGESSPISQTRRRRPATQACTSRRTASRKAAREGSPEGQGRGKGGEGSGRGQATHQGRPVQPRTATKSRQRRLTRPHPDRPRAPRPAGRRVVVAAGLPRRVGRPADGRGVLRRRRLPDGLRQGRLQRHPARGAA